MENFRPELDDIKYSLKTVNELGEGLHDEDMLNKFLTDHAELPIPDFEVLYNHKLKDSTKTLLALNFIKRNYIVGYLSFLYAGTAEQNIEGFKECFPELKLPDNLPAEKLIEFIKSNYESEGAFDIIEREEGLSTEEAITMEFDQHIVTKTIAPSQFFEFDTSRKTNWKFHSVSRFQEKVPLERPKLPWELACIGIANQIVMNVMTKYGLNCILTDPNQVHILARSIPGIIPGIGAYMRYSRQSIVVVQAQTPETLVNYLVHEMLHRNSYFSLRLDEKTGDWEPERLGFDMANNNHGQIDEAIISTLAIRSVNSPEISENQLLKPYFQELENARKRPLVKILAGSDHIYGLHKKFCITFPVADTYSKQRKLLDVLVAKIASKNNVDPETIFDQFAKTTLGQSLIGIGRVVDRTFGNGTFRRIMTADTTKKLGTVVNSLS
jgi:hypothetical protein